MEPESYLHQIREPLLLILQEFAKQNDLLQDEKISSNQDVRDVLRRCTHALQGRANRLRGTAEVDGRRSHYRLINVLRLMTDVFNLHAHNHVGDVRNLSLAMLSGVNMLRQNHDIEGEDSQAAWESAMKLEEALLETVALEYVRASSEESRQDDLANQIQALHDKLDQLSERNGNAASVTGARYAATKLPKHERLHRIRAEIHEFALQRGKQMLPYQHLLQFRHLDFLISENPQSREELHNWARRLPSYEQNRLWIDRQVERWGDQIIEAVRNE